MDNSLITDEYNDGTKKSEDLIIGEYIYINKFPCQISEITRTKKGKCGIPKVFLTGIDVYTKRKCVGFERVGVRVKVFQPIIEEYELVGINDDYLSLLDKNLEVRDDLKLPSGDLGQEIKSQFERSMGIICVVMNFNDLIGITETKLNK
ncbi:Eukaryotic translation initiation factor 5A [Entamoeba marina]